MELNEKYFLKCNSKKKIAMRNACYLKNLGSGMLEKYGKEFKFRLERRAERINQCLDYWDWNKYEKNKVLDLQRVYRCKDMFCPNCRSWSLAKKILLFQPIFTDMLRMGFSPYMITLTVPNIKGEMLKDEINEINRAFYKLWSWLSKDSSKGFKDRIFDVMAAVKSLELTVNEETYMFHVHAHAIVFIKNETKEQFIKDVPGGYRYKSDEYIFYSQADIFIQKLWTMAYKKVNITDFNIMSDKWQDNYICDIRELNVPGGIYEVFKYCFKDLQILDFKVFNNIYFGLINKRLHQGYGYLIGINKEKDDDELTGENLNQYINILEDPEKLITSSVLAMVNEYRDYKKISRFKSDVEFEKIKD